MRPLVAVLTALLLSCLFSTAAHAEQAGVLTGTMPPQGGVALALWSGGGIDDLISEAELRGCPIVSVWTTPDGGGLVGYIPTPIEVVNARFLAAYPGGLLPQTPVLVVCRPSALPLEPKLPDGSQELGGASLTFQLQAGTVIELDTVQATRDAGVDPPACAGLVFAAAWSADGPGAQTLTVESILQGSAYALSSGAADRATVGCTVLRFTAEDTVSLRVTFLVGALQ